VKIEKRPGRDAVGPEEGGGCMGLSGAGISPEFQRVRGTKSPGIMKVSPGNLMAVGCDVIGQPDWTREERFRTLLNRKENEDELESLIAGWTLSYTADQLMHMLQAAGVPAGVVQTAEDLFNDPQLKHREHFRFLEHKVIGVHAYHSPAYRLSKTPCEIRKAGPCLGEDNEYVYKEILGLSDDEIADLLIEGVITTDTDMPEALCEK